MRRVDFEISLVTPYHVSVMLDPVRTATFLTSSAVSFACKGRMAPFPAVMALRDAWIHVCASDGDYVPAKVE